MVLEVLAAHPAWRVLQLKQGLVLHHRVGLLKQNNLKRTDETVPLNGLFL